MCKYLYPKAKMVRISRMQYVSSHWCCCLTSNYFFLTCIAFSGRDAPKSSRVIATLPSTLTSNASFCLPHGGRAHVIRLHLVESTSERIGLSRQVGDLSGTCKRTRHITICIVCFLFFLSLLLFSHTLLRHEHTRESAECRFYPKSHRYCAYATEAIVNAFSAR